MKPNGNFIVVFTLYIAIPSLKYYEACVMAYKTGYKIKPYNFEYKKQVISTFYAYSEQFFSLEEYYQYAIDILKYEPDNKDAREIFLKLQ